MYTEVRFQKYDGLDGITTQPPALDKFNFEIISGSKAVDLTEKQGDFEKRSTIIFSPKRNQGNQTLTLKITPKEFGKYLISFRRKEISADRFLDKFENDNVIDDFSFWFDNVTDNPDDFILGYMKSLYQNDFKRRLGGVPIIVK